MEKNYLLKGTDGDPFTKGHYRSDQDTEEEMQVIRQKSLYNHNDRARVDNNQFFEKRSNPLSSKGN